MSLLEASLTVIGHLLAVVGVATGNQLLKDAAMVCLAAVGLSLICRGTWLESLDGLRDRIRRFESRWRHRVRQTLRLLPFYSIGRLLVGVLTVVLSVLISLTVLSAWSLDVIFDGLPAIA